MTIDCHFCKEAHDRADKAEADNRELRELLNTAALRDVDDADNQEWFDRRDALLRKKT